MATDESTIQISATVPVELHQRLAIQAVTLKSTRSACIVQALSEWLGKQSAK